MQRDAGLCQVCNLKGRLTVGNIVDHIKPKAEGGTDDLGNLQVICKPCHTMKTAGESARGGAHVRFEPEWLPQPLVPVTVVCGPPGSGKTTYVQQHASVGELVLDIDMIAAELFNLPPYHATFEQIKSAIRYRNKLLAGLADSSCGYTKAWLIVTAGSDAKRQFWRGKYGELIIMKTQKRECMERIRNDDRRPDRVKRAAVEAVLQWV